MPGTLTIHVNRADLYSLEVPDSFSTEGEFTIELVNHGAPVHIHVNLDDSLARIADLGTTNHYLTADATREIAVDVRPGSGAVTGQLKVATAHGAETRFVDVEIERPQERSVEVDPDLSKPPTEETDVSLAAAFGDAGHALPRGGSLAVLALAVLAVVLAVTVVGSIGGVGGAIGAFVVLLAVSAAVYLVYS